MKVGLQQMTMTIASLMENIEERQRENQRKTDGLKADAKAISDRYETDEKMPDSEKVRLRSMFKDLDECRAASRRLQARMSEAKKIAAEEAEYETRSREVYRLDSATGRYVDDDGNELTPEMIDANRRAVGDNTPFVPAQRKSSDGKPHYDEVARIGNEPSVYRARIQRNWDGTPAEPTYLQDLYACQIQKDPVASERIARHGRQVELERPEIMKYRAIGTAAVSGFVPPQYLSDLFAEYARGGRPTANLCASATLPSTGVTFQVPRVTTATATSVQATEGGAIGNQDLDDTLLQVNVCTIAGYVDLSRQALERGVQVDSLVYSDLSADYNAKLDAQVINGTGLNGQHLGMLGVSGINAVAYTDATPTIPECWPKLADAVGKVVSGRFTGPTAMVMTPTCWAWILAEKDSTGRPLVEPEGVAVNPIATPSAGAPQYPGVAGRLFGVPVILDGNMPSNLGAGTNETRVLVADFRDAILFEDGSAPAQLRFEDVLSATLQVRLVAYGYSGFAGGRQPKAISVVSGTGLIVPAL